MVSALDSPRPLTKTLGLSGEFFNYEIDGTAFRGWLDPGLSSDCVNSWNPLMVSGYCWLILINFHLGTLHYVCLCVCVCLRMYLYVSACMSAWISVSVCVSVHVCVYLCVYVLFPQIQRLLFQQFQIPWFGRKLVLSNANKVITKATFAHYSYIYILESIFSDFSIDMCRGHLSYFVVTLRRLSMLFLGPASLRQKSGIDFLAHFLFCLN